MSHFLAVKRDYIVQRDDVAEITLSEASRYDENRGDLVTIRRDIMVNEAKASIIGDGSCSA